MSPESAFEREEAARAAGEAAGIGGEDPEPGVDPAERAVREAGGGESEGFEDAEQELIEHASHGDQQAAHAILHDQGLSEEQNLSREDSESDAERSSELDDSQ